MPCSAGGLPFSVELSALSNGLSSCCTFYPYKYKFISSISASTVNSSKSLLKLPTSYLLFISADISNTTN